jgi:hypothetical protein
MKAMFVGQEFEIIVKSVEPEQQAAKKRAELLQMIRESRVNAPIIDPSININGLIDGWE